MQFPKASLVIGALALGAAGSLCAADNPAQAAARMAMVQKLSELSAQSPPATNAAVTPKVAAAKPVKAKTPAVSKVKTLPPGNPSAPTAAVAAPTVIAAQPAPVAEPVTPCPAVMTNACAQTKADLKTAPAPAKNTGPAAAAWYPGKETGLPPLVAPASPLAPDQQAKLQTLLEKYKADQLTSEQYQQQRAAILAAP
jgi:hypothetical protein